MVFDKPSPGYFYIPGVPAFSSEIIPKQGVPIFVPIFPQETIRHYHENISPTASDIGARSFVLVFSRSLLKWE